MASYEKEAKRRHREALQRDRQRAREEKRVERRLAKEERRSRPPEQFESVFDLTKVPEEAHGIARVLSREVPKEGDDG